MAELANAVEALSSALSPIANSSKDSSSAAALFNAQDASSCTSLLAALERTRASLLRHEQDSRTEETQGSLEDRLDAVGAATWNFSSRLRLELAQDKDDTPSHAAELVAQLRYTAFLLLELGAPSPIPLQAALRHVQLARKALDALHAFSTTAATVAADTAASSRTLQKAPWSIEAASDVLARATLLYANLPAQPAPSSATASAAALTARREARLVLSLAAVRHFSSPLVVDAKLSNSDRSTPAEERRRALTSVRELLESSPSASASQHIDRALDELFEVAVGVQNEASQAPSTATLQAGEEVLLAALDIVATAEAAVAPTPPPHQSDKGKNPSAALAAAGKTNESKLARWRVDLLRALVNSYIAQNSRVGAEGSRLSAQTRTTALKKVESTLDELLSLEDDVSARRKKARLVIDRGGSDAEVTAAFSAAVRALKRATPPTDSTSASPEPRSGLSKPNARSLNAVIELAHHLPSSRLQLKLALLASVPSLVDLSNVDPQPASTALVPADPESASDTAALAPVSPLGLAIRAGIALFFLVPGAIPPRPPSGNAPSDGFKEAQHLCSALSSHLEKVPDAARYALCTLLWSKGDARAGATARSGGGSKEAGVDSARWYELSAKVAPKTARDKSLRKAAVALLEVGEVSDAAALLDRMDDTTSTASLSARTCFMRLALAVRMDDENAALESLRTARSCADFAEPMLLWAARAALKKRLGRLLAATLEAVHEVASETSSLDEAFLIVRCMLRVAISGPAKGPLAASKLEEPLSLAWRFIEKASPQQRKNGEASIAWIARIAYNTAFNVTGTPDELARVHAVVAQLLNAAAAIVDQCDEPVVPAAEMRERAVHAKLAALVYRVSSTTKDRSQLLECLDEVQALSSQAASTKSDTCSLALSVCHLDVLGALGRWEEVSNALESLPPPALKSVAERAASSATCSLETLCKILRSTVSILSKQGELDIVALARWLRTLIAYLGERRAFDEVLEHLETARSLLDSYPFPDEELDWLISYAWDQGIELLKGSAISLGNACCQAAVSLARHSAVHLHLVQRYESVRRSYGL